MNELFFQPFINYCKFHKFLYNFNDDEKDLLFYNDFIPFGMVLNDVERFYNRFTKKYSRALKRINLIFKNYQYVYFCTFTFNDKYLLKHNKCISNFIKNALKPIRNNICYVGNIDYGSINERVHYHFVIGSNIVLNKDNLKWLYGFYDIRTCNLNSKSLAKYINKLTNHSFKKSFKLIYSRIV